MNILNDIDRTEFLGRRRLLITIYSWTKFRAAYTKADMKTL